MSKDSVTTDAPATAALVRFEQERDRADRLEYAAGTYMGENLLLKDKIFELEFQLSALQADAQPQSHDQAQQAISDAIRRIQIICDAFGYDPAQWLSDVAALSVGQQAPEA